MGEDRNRERHSTAVEHLPLSGEPLPLDLVNTTYIRGGLRGQFLDALVTPDDLDVWLAAHREAFSPGLGPALARAAPSEAADVLAFVELRQALRGVTHALTSRLVPDPDHIAVVNAAARSAARWSELGPGPSLVAVPRWLEDDPRRVARGEVATAAVALFSGESAGRIRACEAPGCILYFVKVHARRAWCTAGCGNRVRVARHSRRARGEDGSEPKGRPG
ncbi:CGNR zinc finger domain-containing protein [Streptomyces sp. NPDC012825]|uniref:CGNR zinc finger domain-containing protein n=1 Tax=Streptomyces sp. NPDC012825 TaxID=3364851 RepID=UPI00368AB63E